jgi:hypothetical protein
MPTGNNQQSQDELDLRQWIASIAADGTLTQDEIANLQNILGKEKVAGRVRDGVLMRADYTRKTQELADQRRNLESDVQSVLNERQSLAQWKQGIDEKFNKVVADLEAARITEGQFRARIKTLAATYGADEAALFEGITTPAAGVAPGAGGGTGAPAGAGNGNGDQPKYITEADLQRLAAQRDRQMLALMADFPEIAEEHQELFGKSLRTFEYTDAAGNVLHGRAALLQKALDANAQATRQGRQQQTLRSVWESTFEVPKKRQELERATLTQQIRGELEGEYRQKATEAALEGGLTGGKQTQRDHSLLFSKEMKTPAEKDAARAAASGSTAQGDNGRLPPPQDTAVGRETRWMKAAQGYTDRRAKGIPLGQPEQPVSKTA